MVEETAYWVTVEESREDTLEMRWLTLTCSPNPNASRSRLSSKYFSLTLLRYSESLRMNVRPCADAATRILGTPTDPNMLGRRVAGSTPLSGDVLRAYENYASNEATASGPGRGWGCSSAHV